MKVNSNNKFDPSLNQKTPLKSNINSTGFQQALAKQATLKENEKFDSITISTPFPIHSQKKDISKSSVVSELSTKSIIAEQIETHTTKNPVINSTDSVDVKLEKLRQMAANDDFTGMSDAEIYKAVYDRYDDAFNGNMPAILVGIYPGDGSISIGGEKIKTRIVEQFRDQARNISAFDEAMGYENLSFDEKEAAIIKKYTGKTTFSDFINMQGELQLSGVLKNKFEPYNGGAFSVFIGVGIESAIAHEFNLDTFTAIYTDEKLFQEKFISALEMNFDGISFIMNKAQDLINGTSIVPDKNEKDAFLSVYNDYITMFIEHSMFDKSGGIEGAPAKSLKGADKEEFEAFLKNIFDRLSAGSSDGELIDSFMKKVSEHQDKMEGLQEEINENKSPLAESVEKIEKTEPTLTNIEEDKQNRNNS